MKFQGVKSRHSQILGMQFAKYISKSLLQKIFFPNLNLYTFILKELSLPKKMIHLAWPPLGKFYGSTIDWIQVTHGVTLSNVTPPNNLFQNSYFENPTVELHVIYVLNKHANFYAN